MKKTTPNKTSSTTIQNRLVIILSVILSLGIIVFAIIIFIKNSQKITLESASSDATTSQQSYIQNISVDQLHTFINEKRDFTLFVSQPNCITATNLRQIISDLSRQQSAVIYEIPFSQLRASGLANEVRFYPSFIIYRHGEIVDFLDANDSADTDAYTSADGFRNWLTQYVLLKD